MSLCPEGKSQLASVWKQRPGGTSGKEPACQSQRHKRYGFHPWVGKIPWRRTSPPTQVFSPGESHGQRRLMGITESDMTEGLNTHTHRGFHVACGLRLFTEKIKVHLSSAPPRDEPGVPLSQSPGRPDPMEVQLPERPRWVTSDTVT